MSYDDYYDDGRDEFIEQIGQDAIANFQTERLQSFYKKHGDLALQPMYMRNEAKSVLEKSPSAALVLAMASIEVGFKGIIIEPIISGLVHEESLASLVTETFMKSARHDGVLKIVDRVVKKYASIDLRAVALPQHSNTYLAEVGEAGKAQKLRNAVLHKADLCSRDDTERVIELADYLWDVIFLEMIKGLGLHTHDNQTVCEHYQSKCDSLALIEKLGLQGKFNLVDQARLDQKK